MSRSYELLPSSIKEELGIIENKSKPTPPDLEDIKYIASGSYGAAVEPAFPNYNTTTGQWVYYPKSISKLFFRKNTKNYAMKQQLLAKNILKNENLRISNYKYKYTKKNIPAKLLPTNILSKMPENLQLVKMPNLGKDIFHYVNIYLNPNKTAEDISILNNIANFPFEKSLKEIMRLIYYVALIKKKGYIHADIKIENILMKEDGKLTLIDYDFFDTKDNFYLKASSRAMFGFYNQPIESFLFYLLNDIDNANIDKINNLDINNLINFYESNIRMKLKVDNYLTTNIPLYKVIGIDIDKSFFYNYLLANLKDFATLYNQNKVSNQPKSIYSYYKDYILEKFDSYNLGLCLFICYYIFYNYMFFENNQTRKDFIYNKLKKFSESDQVTKYLTENYYNLLEELKYNVLYKMIDPVYLQRMGIEDANLTIRSIIQIYSTKINEYLKQVNTNKKNNKTKNTNSKKNTTNNKLNKTLKRTRNTNNDNTNSIKSANSKKSKI